ncbi:MAG TPA: hypothetical protein VHE79_05905, partial [Spirochaetia bacterium]
LVGSSQPTVGLSISSSLGPVTLGLSSSLDYGWNGSWTDTLSTLLSVTWNLVAVSELDAVSFLGIGAGAFETTALSPTSPFTFQDALDADPRAWSSTIGLPIVVAGDWHRAQSRIELNPVLGVNGRIQATTYLPVLSLATTAVIVDLSATLTVPSPIPHQALKLGVKAETDVAGLAAPYVDSFTLPRGFPSARTRSAEAGLLASVDYLAPIALLDQPLLLGFALTGLGVSLHAEMIADAGLAVPSLAVSPTLYLGGDVTVRVAFNGLSLPLGIGLAVAVTPGAALDPARDLGLYLFTGFDSLGNAGWTARPLLPRAAGAWYTAGDAG